MAEDAEFQPLPKSGTYYYIDPEHIGMIADYVGENGVDEGLKTDFLTRFQGYPGYFAELSAISDNEIDWLFDNDVVFEVFVFYQSTQPGHYYPTRP